MCVLAHGRQDVKWGGKEEEEGWLLVGWMDGQMKPKKKKKWNGVPVHIMHTAVHNCTIIVRCRLLSFVKKLARDNCHISTCVTLRNTVTTTTLFVYSLAQTSTFYTLRVIHLLRTVIYFYFLTMIYVVFLVKQFAEPTFSFPFLKGEVEAPSSIVMPI